MAASKNDPARNNAEAPAAPEEGEKREAANATEQQAAQEHTDPDIVVTGSQLEDPERDEMDTPSTAKNPDGSVVRDFNGAARSTGSVAIKPLYEPEGEEEPNRRLQQTEKYQNVRQRIIDAYRK